MGVRRFGCLIGLAVVSSCLALLAPCASAEADTIRLKNGKTVEGQVVRADSAQVVVIVPGGTAFFASAEVASITYSAMRIIASSTPTSAPASSAQEAVAVDRALIGQVRERLVKFHGFFKGARHAVPATGRRGKLGAVDEIHAAAHALLPTHRGRFSPFSALADLLILLGLRAPILWLALALVRERRAFTRIAEFLVIAYGLMALLITCTLMTAQVWVLWLALALGLGGLVALFTWIFGLRVPFAFLALALAIGMNLSIEYVLVQARWI